MAIDLGPIWTASRHRPRVPLSSELILSDTHPEINRPASPMDKGHFNCRDYHIPQESVYDLTIRTITPSLRHTGQARNPLAPKAFPLLRLPFELRQQIFSYLLPNARLRSADTVSLIKPRVERTSQSFGRIKPPSIVWYRGQTSLLCVCRQLHDECATQLYGSSVFELFVTYDSITFRSRWLLPSGLAPTRHDSFLMLIPPRYLRLIKQLQVTLDHVDSYTGMIKYNVGGKGLTHGLTSQVQILVDRLRQDNDVETLCEQSRIRLGLRSLHLKLMNGNDHLDTEKKSIVRQREIARNIEEVQKVLAPFAELCGLSRVQIEGAVSEEYAEFLESSMTQTCL